MTIDRKKIKNEDADIILYENIFRQYYKPLIKFAYRYVNSVTVSENIIHDVFLYLWNERNRLDFTVNIKSYLYNAVKNSCLNYVNKKKLENSYKISDFEVSYDGHTPESILINKELEVAIKEAVNNMPKKRREIFIMNRFDRLTYVEIASVLNISIKTVETQMSRSLKFLRKRLFTFFVSLI